MCGVVPLDFEGDFVEPQNYEGTLVNVPQKKDEDAAAAAELFFVNGRRKPLERSRKNSYCKDGAVREQQWLYKIGYR